MSREYARKQMLQSADFQQVLSEVQPILDTHFCKERVPCYCLIGGLAVSAYANPPVTVDIDFLVDATRRELMAFIQQINRETPRWHGHPIRFGRMGPGETGFGVRLRRIKPFEAVVDALSTENDWYLKLVIAQSRILVPQHDVSLRVATPEDLIVLKTLAGREKDADDIAQLEQLPGVNDDYVQATLDRLLGGKMP